MQSSIYKMQTQVSQERVLQLQNKLMDIQHLLSNDKKEQLVKEQKIQHLHEIDLNLQKQVDALESQIATIKHKAGELFGFSTYSIKSVDKKTKNRINSLEAQINILNSKIDANDDKADKLDKIFTFSDTKARIKTAIANLNALMSEVFDVFLTWVIMFFFKNIFFPILFLWLLFKVGDNAMSKE
jgi:cob(I)alamin adenosyltransferase